VQIARQALGGVLGLALIAIAPQTTAAMEILLRDPHCERPAGPSSPESCLIIVDLVGTIERGDDRRVEKIIAQINAEHPGATGITITFRPNSLGGDLDVAMAIGRDLRKWESFIFMLPGTRCVSSCVLLLAGAVFRTIYGSVEIHRPYFTQLDPKLSRQDVDAYYKAMTRQVAEYLDEMNVPRALADAMMAIPPQETHLLTETELQGYMLDQFDPVYSEQGIARQAKRYGLTSAVYRERSAQVRELCRFDGPVTHESSNRYEICQLSVFEQISISEAAVRQDTLTHLRASPQFYTRPQETRQTCEESVLSRGARSCP
jgi:hypothetical protein